MAITAVRDERGFPRAACICDGCSREEVVPASHKRGRSQDDEVNEGPVIRKLRYAGWSKIKKKLLCPSCEFKRKSLEREKSKHEPPEKWAVGGEKYPVKPEENGTNVVKMQAKTEAPREATPAQKREIFKMLDVAYDCEAERYTGGDTDETVAGVLGVMPGWVAKIREEAFGPAGGNEDIAALKSEIDGFLGGQDEARAKIDALTRDMEAAVKALDHGAKRAAEFKTRLEKIEKAVGPRVMQRA